MRVAVLIGRDPEERFSLHRGYLDGVWAVGGVPIVIPAAPPDHLDAMVDAVRACDAVLVTGGGDVDPRLYGEQPVEQVAGVDTTRDALEIAVVRWAAGTGRRILGICRGAQLVNVAFGGTLVQDLPSEGKLGHSEEKRPYEPVHGIDADGGTAALAALAGAQAVNSLHHQAVRVPGDGLRATAWAPDGVVEAVEGDGVLAVQWHPERLLGTDGRHVAAFSWLAAS